MLSALHLNRRYYVQKKSEDTMEITISDGGFLGMLTILFIGLKLLDKIDWSWFWVLSPIIIPLILVIGIFFIIIIILLIGAVLE